LVHRDPDNSQWQRDLAVSHNKIGDTLLSQGDQPEALTAYRASLAIRETLAHRDPGNSQWQRDLSVSHDRIGDVLMSQGNLPGALTAYRASHAIAETLVDQDPGNNEWQRDLIVSHVKLSEMTSDTAYVRKALEITHTMLQQGTLAPRDAWMIEDLTRRSGL